jgi:hypothetical protein
VTSTNTTVDRGGQGGKGAISKLLLPRDRLYPPVHPCPETHTPRSERCDVLGCRSDASRFPAGTYCGRHSVMFGAAQPVTTGTAMDPQAKTAPCPGCCQPTAILRIGDTPTACTRCRGWLFGHPGALALAAWPPTTRKEAR